MEEVPQLPSAEEYMRSIGVKRLTKLFPKYLNRWVPVSEALPPERMYVIVAFNDLDTPAFSWLKYAGGDKWSPFFVCPHLASMAPRGAVDEDLKDEVFITHWFSPTLDGIDLPRTSGLYSPIGLGRVWHNTSEMTRKVFDDYRYEKINTTSHTTTAGSF